MAQRRVEPRREAEADAGLLDAARDTVAVELERHTESLEQIGRSARRRRRAVAVLAHRNTGPGDDERGQRRHVDRVTAIATGADHVDEPVTHIVGHIDGRGNGEHRVEQAVELLDGLALHPQRDREAGDLGRASPRLRGSRPSQLAPGRG